MKFIRFILLTISVLFSMNSTCQDDSSVEEYFEIADSLHVNGDFKNAIFNIEKALEELKGGTEWEKTAKGYNRLAINYMFTPKIETAKEFAEKALSIVKTNSQGKSIEEVWAYQNLGDYYKKKSNYKECLNYRKKALFLRNSILPDDERSIALNHSDVASIYSILGDNEKTLVHLDSAKNIWMKNEKLNLGNLANYYSLYGRMLSMKGENDNAIAALIKARDILSELPNTNVLIVAKTMAGIAGVYYNAGFHGRSVEENLKALAIFKSKLGDKHGIISVIYNSLSRGYSRLGEYSKALEYSKKALLISEGIYDKNHRQIGSSYSALASTYDRSKDYENALKYYYKTVENNKINYGEKAQSLIFIYSNIGRMLCLKKSYQESLEYYNKSIEIGTELFDEEHPNLAFTYQMMADTQKELGLIDEGLANLNKAIAIREKAGDRNWELGVNYNDLAVYLKDIGNYNEAIISYDKSLELYKDELSEVLKLDFSTEKFNVLSVLLKALAGKGDIYRLKYLKEGKKQFLNTANETYAIADIVAKKTQQRVSNYQDNLSLSESNKALLEGAIEINFLLYKENGNAQDLEKAFYYSERSRANTMLKILERNNAKDLDAPLAIIMENQKKLKNEKAIYLSKIESEKVNKDTVSSDILTAYQDKLFRVNQKSDSLSFVLQKEHPNYLNIGKDTELIKVSRIQKELADGTTLLEYFYKGNTTYAFVISKNSFKLLELKTKGISDVIVQFNEAIKGKDLSTFKEKALEIYTSLFAEVKEELKGDNLIIVPDGPIWNINFDLLLVSNTTSNNPKDLPYLLNDYAISYANSSHLFFNPFESTVKTGKEVLAFSFSDSTALDIGGNLSLDKLRDVSGDLPGTRREISTISEILTGDYYYGSEALERNFKENLGKHAIIHLALHGEVDNENPQNSKLYFTQQKDSIEDNFLYNHEIFAMQIPSELAVLSACNTGVGKITSGEGIMSLGNAFQYAGTKSLLLSRWEASDDTTPDLMKLFYINLKKGMNKSKALQEAKISYLKNSDILRSQPFYWGGFYLVGDNNSIDLDGPINWTYLILSLLVVAATLFFLRSKKII